MSCADPFISYSLFNGDPILGKTPKPDFLFNWFLNEAKNKTVKTTLSLGETVNAFLNENSQEVFNEVKPNIEKQVGKFTSLELDT